MPLTYPVENGVPVPFSSIWPVGCVYISVLSTPPDQLFGFGTWVAIGAGRALVGLDAGDTDFDAAEKTGGAKTHTLIEAEMPVHTHVQNPHTHVLDRLPTTTGALSGFTADTSMSGAPTATSLVTEGATPTNQNAGGGGAHNNMPPFLVVYMWKRTA